MPQFLREITSVSHSLLCCLKMNWWAPKKQADCSNSADGGAKSSPKECIIQQVLMHGSQDPGNTVEVWYGRGGGRGAAFSLLKRQPFSEAWG